MKTILSILVAAGLWLSSSASESPRAERDGSVVIEAATNFEIDSEHTFLTFKVERFEMVKVVGFFPRVEGAVTFDAADPSAISADIRIPTDNVYLGISDGRDRAVKSPNFLSVQAHPEITFTTTSVRRSGDGYIAEGDLTIRGNTNRIELPFEVKGPMQDPTGLQTLMIEGRVTINRHDYGITFDRKLPGGGDFIGNEVEIELNVLAVAAE